MQPTRFSRAVGEFFLATLAQVVPVLLTLDTKQNNRCHVEPAAFPPPTSISSSFLPHTIIFAFFGLYSGLQNFNNCNGEAKTASLVLRAMGRADAGLSVLGMNLLLFIAHFLQLEATVTNLHVTGLV